MMLLNADVLVLIVEHLDAEDLAGLASTCRLCHHVVHAFGWSIYLRNNQRHSLTLRCSSRRSAFAQVRYDVLADRAWSRATFIARPLSRPWHANLQPTLALSSSTLLVAAGHVLHSYSVQEDTSNASRIVFERSHAFTSGPATAQSDITAVAFLPDHTQDRTTFLGFANGTVEQVPLPPLRRPREGQRIEIERTPHSVLHHHGPDVIRSISCAPHVLLSLSQWGQVFFTSLLSNSSSPASLNLDTRSWTSHLSMSSSSPYAVFGTASPAPLSLYYISPDGFASTPSITLQSPRNRPSAVYGVTCASPSSPLGPSEQIVISGWYDGLVHVHDLRVSHRSQSTPTLLPVLTLRDPWSPEPIYSLSCGGGNGSFVAAGTARHGVISFWDVRQPSQGWSVHSPGNDSSPVYSIVLESSRLFGATQSRPFVYDFGPGVTQDTYPPIAHSPIARRITEDRLKLERNGIGYHVTKYSHPRAGIF